MSDKNFLYDAFLQASVKLANDQLKTSLDRLNAEIKKSRYIHFSVEYTPGTAIYPVIDSTATVISDDVKALSAPGQEKR
jgi:hypothetical protein